jgi:hypothetical protein
MYTCTHTHTHTYIYTHTHIYICIYIVCTCAIERLLSRGVEKRKAMEIVEYKIPGAGRCADAKNKCQKGGRERGRKRGKVITTAVRQQERRKNVRKEEGKQGRTEDRPGEPKFWGLGPRGVLG